MSIISTTKAADEVSGRARLRHWRRSRTPPLLHHPTLTLQGRSTPGNRWRQQWSWEQPRVLKALGGCQAPLDNRDLDFVTQQVEVKNHPKLKLNTAFLKAILKAMHIHHGEQVTSILPNETRMNISIRIRRTKLTLHGDYRPLFQLHFPPHNNLTIWSTNQPYFFSG